MLIYNLYKYISHHFEKILMDIKDIIHRQKDDYILNVNEQEYIEYLAQEFELNFVSFDFENITVDSYEKEVPSNLYCIERFMFYEDTVPMIKRPVYRYYIPYSGDISLLKYVPKDSFTLNPLEISVNQTELYVVVEIVDYQNNPESIKQEFEEKKRNLLTNFDKLKTDCEIFNSQLKHNIEEAFNKRKTEILSKTNILTQLGVPIRKRENVSTTFSIPNPKLREKIIIEKPIVNKDKILAEPTLDIKTYNEILKLINDVGKNLERMPSTYSGLREEALRDHINLVLDPNFQMGSVTGETFNKKGKTDIMLRYDSSVVFVAECKFWQGESVYLKTIDQLLSYLTWRDSKVAVINFVKNKEISNVLEVIKQVTVNHPNYIAYTTDNDENWFNYKFHLNGDRGRKINLAVLSFHLP